MNKLDWNNKLTQWIILISLALIWGSSFILMKRGLESFSYFQVGSFRVFFSFLFYAPFIYKNYKKLNAKNLRWLLVVGFLGNGIPAILFPLAQTQISSLVSGMLNSLVPIFVLIVGVLMFQTKPTFRSILGTIVGLIGAVTLLYFSSKADGQYSNNIYYGLLIVLSTVFYAVSINVTKFKLKGMNGIEISSLAFFFIGPLTGIHLSVSDYTPALATPDFLQNLFYVFFLAMFSSFIAVVLFNNLIQHTEPVFASTVTYIVPVFAISWGIFDGETINLFQIFSILIIFVGVYFVNSKVKTV